MSDQYRRKAIQLMNTGILYFKSRQYLQSQLNLDHTKQLIQKHRQNFDQMSKLRDDLLYTNGQTLLSY